MRLSLELGKALMRTPSFTSKAILWIRLPYWREMTMNENARQALKDMVEFQMYLVAQPQQRPWPMVPRASKTLPMDREPYRNPIESSAANELLRLGLIEYSSSVTLVVSRSGSEFYEREMKPKNTEPSDTPVSGLALPKW